MPRLIDRFLDKVEKTEGCWIWKASKNSKGYGFFYTGRGPAKMDSAHRVSYELFKTAIPPGYNILHRCDTPSCVNPDHLFIGTQKDNIDDMVAKKRNKPGKQKMDDNVLKELVGIGIQEIVNRGYSRSHASRLNRGEVQCQG